MELASATLFFRDNNDDDQKDVGKLFGFKKRLRLQNEHHIT